MRTVADEITIRLAGDRDSSPLSVLAQLDSAVELAEPVLVAESGGQLRAALSLSDGRVVSDPFFRTWHLVALLRLQAAELEVERERATGDGRRRRPRGLHALSPARAA